MKVNKHIAYGHPRRITTPATNFLRRAVGALGLVVGLMALGAAPPATAQPRYTVTNLGTLGGPASNAYGINNLGQVVGESFTSPYPHGFRTAPNSPINPATDDLGAFGGCTSYAESINNLGQVAGWGLDSCAGGGREHAFRTAPNSPINPATDDLRVPANGRAAGINDSGQVVGLRYSTGPLLAWRTAPNSPFNAATDDLGTLGGSYSRAFGINSLGQVVGASSTASGQVHAFRTVPNSPINPANDDLDALGGSTALGINNLGQVVGSSYFPGSGQYSHAFRTAPNSPINPATDDLGTLGGLSSSAFGINNLGQVVGDSTTTPGPTGATTHAFLYSGSVMYDLNNLIPPGSGWVLGAARAINDLGQIAGSLLVNPGDPIREAWHAFRLDPEPVVFVSSLNDLMLSFGLPDGISTELSALLRASVSAMQEGDNITAQDQLGAFQNKVKPLRGKQLTTTQADILLNAAALAIRMIT